MMNEDGRKDVYAEITNKIIAELEKGVMPWAPNWDMPMPCRPMRASEEPYRGINVLLLWLAAANAGFQSPYWFTYKQIAKAGGYVRKGERATSIVYVGSMAKKEQDENGEDHERKIVFLRLYYVFNLQQTEGMSERYHWPMNWRLSMNQSETIDTIEPVERFFKNTGVEILNDADVPHYSILSDQVHMPPLTAFNSINDYYATLAHEVTHWTGHPARTPRNFPAIIGSPVNYAREELVAELGAAFLCADLELSMQPRGDHAEYIAIWLKILRNDKRAIFQASSMAQKAVDFLQELQRAESIERCRRNAA